MLSKVLFSLITNTTCLIGVAVLERFHIDGHERPRIERVSGFHSGAVVPAKLPTIANAG